MAESTLDCSKKKSMCSQCIEFKPEELKKEEPLTSIQLAGLASNNRSPAKKALNSGQEKLRSKEVVKDLRKNIQQLLEFVDRTSPAEHYKNEKPHQMNSQNDSRKDANQFCTNQQPFKLKLESTQPPK